ncbi:MAG: bacteriohemerythrin [Nitrospirota bacterium]
MGYLKWKNKYSVNVAEIDEQHKKLFDLVNAMYDAMHAGKGSDVIGTVVDEFVDFTDYHFKAEERLLLQHGYPDFDLHKEMHDTLVRKAQSLKEAFDSGHSPTTIEVMLLMANWLNLHILDEDQKYKPYIEGKAANEKKS